jgi:hypothetical protein
MSNILQLPKFASTTSFVVLTNADWLDTLFFAAPGYGGPTVLTGCSTTAGSSTVNVPTTATLISGMLVQQVAGIPPNAFVGAILSATSFHLVDAYGNDLPALASTPILQVTFSPPALDLTGIDFIANVRANVSNARIVLSAQTYLGTLLNGRYLGTLQFNVPQAQVSKVLPAMYVMDILAADGVNTVNLFPQGPASVQFVAGVSDPGLISLS